MKKLVFTAVLLLSLSFSSQAQFHLGVMAGYNSSLSLSNIGDVANGTYNSTNVSNELWNDFHAGVFARIPLGKMIYLQPEVLYSIQKKNFTLGIPDLLSGGKSITVDRFANFSTVDVPILVGAKLLDLKIVNLRAFAGPMLRFDAGSKLSYENLTSGATIDKNQLLNEVQKANLGFEAGLGVDVLMFALDFRYNLIADMYKNPLSTLTPSSLSSIPANTFVISLGWKLF
ncbi:MAG: porin family protein [Paludibacter sp.]